MKSLIKSVADANYLCISFGGIYVRHRSGFGAGGSGTPPLPPPPPGFAKVLATQTELLRQIV